MCEDMDVGISQFKPGVVTIGPTCGEKRKKTQEGADSINLLVASLQKIGHNLIVLIH